MRGKQDYETFVDNVLGLIPAHAGKTFSAPLSSFQTWAHPRACGENQVRCEHFINILGSSPRMRGKLTPWLMKSHSEGLIPAHAGKTPADAAATLNAAAHPRACGENREHRPFTILVQGSSPRMRGKQLLDREKSLAPRLIPAHAGKTEPSTVPFQ